jgi:hypothetical protein
MLWQHTLIRIYCFVDDLCAAPLANLLYRRSNNDQPAFSDAEVLTVYLFGLTRQHRTLKAIHDYTRDHLAPFFPHVPKYGAFVQRLNRLGDAFPLIAEYATEHIPDEDVIETVGLIDSMPIALASHGRALRGRVAPELADKGYCCSKKLYYYGVKLHVGAARRPGSLPVPRCVGLTPASEHDLTALRRIASHLSEGAIPAELYADKAYLDASLRQTLTDQTVEIEVPVKLEKGQRALLMTDQVRSSAISRVRQPIESLFNWIQEKTGIECGSKVRSSAGLLVHGFGRYAAAMIMLWFKAQPFLL